MIDTLFKLVRRGFEKLSENRSGTGNTTYEQADFLSNAFAMFSLKDPSLSQYQKEFTTREANLKRVYGIEKLPKDTAFREGIDKIPPKVLQGEFKPLLKKLGEEKVLEDRKVLGKYLVISCDGTQNYCSGSKQCAHCLVRKHRNGKQTYYHQSLAAVNVHPDQATVFPIAVEAIVKQDGAKKNDCELNASKRLIPQIRQMLPTEELLANFDALYANGPHIKTLREHDMRFIISIKDGYVLEQVKQLKKKNSIQTIQWTQESTLCTINYGNKLILNGQHQDILVNFFEYTEVDTLSKNTTFYSSWITDIPITQHNIKELVAVARSRWKIENETFNTMKNQGYHFGRNYGHGKKYLATNFALITFMAFLVDQIAQHLDTMFQKTWKIRGTKKALWRKVQQVFDLLPVMSMNAIYRFICGEIDIDFPLIE